MRAFLLQYAQKAAKKTLKPGGSSRPGLKPFYQLRRVQPFSVNAFSKHISDTREPEAEALFTPYLDERKDWVDIQGHSQPSLEGDDITSVLIFYEEELYGDTPPDPKKTTFKAASARAWPVTTDDLTAIIKGDQTKLEKQVGKKKASEITVELAVGYLEGKNIRLFSCSSGLYSKTLGKNLAQELANKTGRYVMAADYDPTARRRSDIDLSNPSTGKEKELGYAYLDPSKGSWYLFKPGEDATQKQPGRLLGRMPDGRQKLEVSMGDFRPLPWVDTATDDAEQLIAEDLKANPKLLDQTEEQAEAGLNSIRQLDNLVQPDTRPKDIDLTLQPLETQDMSKIDKPE